MPRVRGPPLALDIHTCTAALPHWHLPSACSIGQLRINFAGLLRLAPKPVQIRRQQLRYLPPARLMRSVTKSAAPCGQRQIAPAFRRYKQFKQAGGCRGAEPARPSSSY